MKRILLLLGFVFFSLGCAEVIELENDRIGGQLVIFGRITNGGDGNIVNITRTQEDGQAPLDISGATVVVVDENGNREQYVEIGPGTYELNRSLVVGQVGGTYHLEVMVDGKLYTSSLQEMMPAIADDELRFEVDINEDISPTGASTRENVIRVFATSTFQTLPEEFYLRWKMEEVYTTFGISLPRGNFPRYTPQQCYVTNELSAQDIFLVDGTAVRNVELANREVAVRKMDFSFERKHYFNIIQFGLNEESHEYWKKLQSITTRQGSIFDVAPAAVPGNFTSSDPEEDVFGFFEASSADTTRVFTTRNDIPFAFVDPCQVTREEFFLMTRVPFECLSCLVEEEIVEAECLFCSLLPNSSLRRPSYF
ncbi:DUF4249 family protein [Roseivirga misakiensis]|uniref:DUF4249 domain-containing protein n=1 Tax=Roseivirga misakiensis TaxID=1563681 RepID=A0A1E5T5B1_9BACT|nr:DUF4249 family protein [Roseivirga misakiensis]OEK06571.1 hypothetical protein BFP71_02550 [Roseivirga misakiensis]